MALESFNCWINPKINDWIRFWFLRHFCIYLSFGNNLGFPKFLSFWAIWEFGDCLLVKIKLRMRSNDGVLLILRVSKTNSRADQNLDIPRFCQNLQHHQKMAIFQSKSDENSNFYTENESKLNNWIFGCKVCQRVKISEGKWFWSKIDHFHWKNTI